MSRILRHFSLFLLLSFLLHLGVFFYFATTEKNPTTSKQPPPPFFVELREAEQKPRELELPLRQLPTLRTQPGKRMAASEQVVTHEQAPKGDDWRDSSTAPAAVQQQESIDTKSRTVSEKGVLSPLSPEALLLSTKSAAQTVADLDPEINRIMRRDVEEGRAVWLDTEKDILGSFYKRFRDAVEGVWGYPQEAIDRGESGTCLYRIEINRAGVLIKQPELLKSSGSPRLDAEAAQAVAKASPRFGFLPDAYRYETLTIFAYFDYRIGNRPRIYGESYYR